MKCVLKDSVSRTLASQRLVNGIDSRVVLGCWGKGRSSSNKLNAVARSCIGWAVLGRKRLVNFWLASGDNFSDEPSRFKVLRARAFMPEVPRRLFVPERTPCRTACRGARGSLKICLEVFAGCGRRSVALEAAGMQTGPPLDAYPNGEKVRKSRIYLADHDLQHEACFDRLLAEIRSGLYYYIHFGLPCRHWSVLNQLNGGSRSQAVPEGGRHSRARIVCKHTCHQGGHALPGACQSWSLFFH